MVSGNDLVRALSDLSSGDVREWRTDSYEDAMDVRDFARDQGMKVRIRGNDTDGWVVERLRDEFGRWFP